MYLIGFLAYFIWGDSELQSWAQDNIDETEEIEKEPLDIKIKLNQ